MTTKQDKTPSISKVTKYCFNNAMYDDLRTACIQQARMIVENEIDSIEVFTNNQGVFEKVKAKVDELEREFLRKVKQLEIGKNEALLKVSVIDLKEEIESIEEIRMHVDNPKLLNIRDQLDEWIFNTQPFNDVGLYTIKAKIEEVDCELYSSFMWDFEVIDFKPLEK